MTERLWYERPIVVGTATHNFVRNGEAGGLRFPHRHYWPDVETQRAEIAGEEVENADA